MSIKAMKQAVGALEATYWTDFELCSEAVNALRQAITDAEQPSQREWVNLTDEEVAKIVDMNTSDDAGFDIFCDGHSIASAVMDKLQELNK
jgi:hypothetical protein